MISSQTPSRIPVAFATSGTKNVIPTASQIGITPGAASLDDGFPPLTFTPLAAGGVPPAGADFNGILNAITAIQRWQSAGGLFKYDSTFSASVGGYPKGAVLLKSGANGLWINGIESNTSNPDTGGTGWSDLLAGLGGLTQTEGDARYALLSSLSSYLTTTDAALAYLTIGAAAATYLTEAQGDVRYALTTALSNYVEGAQFTGSNQSLGTNGYQKMPGGLILQWATGAPSGAGDGPQSISFPISFPTSCLNVSVTTHGNGVNIDDGLFQVTSFDQSGVLLYKQNVDPVNSPILTPSIFAIGK